MDENVVVLVILVSDSYSSLEEEVSVVILDKLLLSSDVLESPYTLDLSGKLDVSDELEELDSYLLDISLSYSDHVFILS